MNLANLRRNLHLTAVLFFLTASSAMADLSWNYSSGGESFSLITTGDPADVLAHPPGSVNFLALDFKVHTSTLLSGALGYSVDGYSVSGGQLAFDAMWGLKVTWNGNPQDTGFGCGGGSGCWIGIYLPGTYTGYQLYERFGGDYNKFLVLQNYNPISPYFYTSVTPVAPAAVPEPGAMLLLGSGLAGMVLLRRSRRNETRKTVPCPHAPVRLCP